MALHYILVIVVILCIMGSQLYIYINTTKKIGEYDSIFPQNQSAYRIGSQREHQDDGTDNEEISESCSQIKIKIENPGSVSSSVSGLSLRFY